MEGMPRLIWQQIEIAVVMHRWFVNLDLTHHRHWWRANVDYCESEAVCDFWAGRRSQCGLYGR
jgi:hypothetical protein